MADLVLKTALATYGHTAALKDRTVEPSTFTFAFEEVPKIIHAFRRMVRGLEFDVSEMAITTYICARAHGAAFTAIPVFPMRAFHDGAITYNTRTGVNSPKDLEGKRVGVNRGYTVTTGLWARSILQHEHGVDLTKITWLLSGDEHVAAYRPPANVVPAAPGQTLEQMLAAGEIAAAISVPVDSPDVKPLIPDALEIGLARLRNGGLYPINHTVVVRDDILAANPGLARELFSVFAEAKRRYVERLRADIESPSAANEVFRRVLDMTGDPLPYGVEPNRRVMEAVIQYSLEQGIITEPVTVDELFATGTHDLAG
ncbi:MAG: ABC transporter substrate-binding protein [Acidobacteria bacterium]|nr:ABC transporter substrate-binding protein [Acidobacteriota bacterium]